MDINLDAYPKNFSKYGIEITIPQEGDVVVSFDGKSCGIFVNSTDFVYASFSIRQIVELDPCKLKSVFPDGYQIRREP